MNQIVDIPSGKEDHVIGSPTNKNVVQFLKQEVSLK